MASLEPEDPRWPARAWSRELHAWRVVWVGWLAAVAVIAVVSYHADWVPHRPDFPQGPFWYFFGWDFGWYSSIINGGYPSLVHNPGLNALGRYAFFPLFPETLRIARGLVTPWKLAAAVSVVSSAAIFAGVVALRPAGVSARRVALAMALFPASGALLMAYPDGFSIACCVWACVAAHRRRFWLAAALALAASLARPTGVLVAVALYLLLRDEHVRTRLAVALAPVAATLAVFVFFWQQSGQHLPFRRAEATWGHHGPLGFVSQLTAMPHDHFLAHQISRDLLTFWLVTLPLMVVLARRPWRSPWLWYCGAVLLLAFAPGLWIGTARHTLPAFPLVWAAASLHGRVAIYAVLVGAAGLVYSLITYSMFAP